MHPFYMGDFPAISEESEKIASSLVKSAQRVAIRHLVVSEAGRRFVVTGFSGPGPSVNAARARGKSSQRGEVGAYSITNGELVTVRRVHVDGSVTIEDGLRYVHGVSNEELREPVYTLAVGETHVQVPSPIALLQAKLANVADIAQTGRQDARHVAILAQVLPAYLEDLQKAVIEGRMEERKLIEFLERLLAVVTAVKAWKAFKELKLDARQLFAGLGHKKLPKLRAFAERRLPRVL